MGVYFKSVAQCKKYYFKVVDYPSSAGKIENIEYNRIPSDWKLCTI